MNKKQSGVMKSKAVLALSKMPELKHWPDRERPFNIMESEVVKWMVNQPDVMQWFYEKARNLDVAIYDCATNKWRGIELELGN